MLSKKRSRKSQSKHDSKVRSIARGYKQKGWKVAADIPGFPRPKPIGKHKRVPDVVATRPGTRHITEVETKETVKTDRGQRGTFKRSAAKRRRTKYREVIV